MDAEDFKVLHAAVANGDVEIVRRELEEHSEEQFFSYKETSALFKAFSCESYEIISYLILKGAKIHDSEVYDLYRLEIDLTRVNHMLLNYNKKSEKSCVFQLMSWSQSPQGLDGERLSAIVSLYEEFFKSEIIRILMKVLEGENFDIVYDFSSEDVNRVYRLYEEECEVFGLTLSKSKEIFIGAKNLLSVDPRKRARVYGVVAEELCHLTLTILFENNAKPFREEDSKLNQEFWDIVLAVRTSLLSSCHVESVIEDVFLNYEYFDWVCELIARVPHVVGIYGEEFGRRVFLETPELSNLLLFYDKNVLPKCKEYTDPSLNTKSHRMMEQLKKKNEFISFREKQIPPLKKGFRSFRDYLVDEEGVSVITTNCTKLCTLQVYHELKNEFSDQLEKKCLFFSWKSFEKEEEKILNAFKGKVWEYLILVLDGKEINMGRFKEDYLYCLDEFKMEGITIIMISSSKFLGGIFENQAVNYKWEDLSDECLNSHQIIRYVFKGKEESLYVPKECFPKVFGEDLIRIVGGEVIEVYDGVDLISKGYISETYLEREFKAMTVDRKVFDNLPFNTSIFLSGLNKREFQKSSIDKNVVQWLQGPDDVIRDDKSIFIVNGSWVKSFKDIVWKNPRKRNIWLHFDNEEFILRNSNSFGDDLQHYLKQITLSEKEMLKFLERKRIVIISDNAGYGKSTVISSLVRGLREKMPQSWVWRVDFNKFLTKDENSLSLVHITEDSDDKEVIEHLFLFLGIDNGLERHLFQEFGRYGHCFIFFDGFDEIPSKYKSSALKLLSAVSKKTSAKMIITTRKHHQNELEELLNTFSHQLVPFSRENQARYLEKLWRSKLKYPNGEASQRDEKDVPEKIKNIIAELRKEKNVLGPEHQDLILALEKIELEKSLDLLRSDLEQLNLIKLGEHVLEKILLEDKSLEFMGIPLHLYMMGIIQLNGNFNVEIQSEIHSLYSDFVDQKILIYLEEKQELKEGPFKDKNVLKIREDAFRIHIELADHLIDEGKVYLDSNMDEEDLELCSALGIVFIHGGEVHFLHKTFAEFFKAESLRRKLRKDVFIKMLSEDNYNVVRRFLSSALEKENFENLTKEFFRNIDFLVTIMQKIVDVDPGYVWYKLDFSMLCCFKVVKRLLQMFEKITETRFVNTFLKVIHRLAMKSCKQVDCGSNCMFQNSIGGCLTVYMLNYLLTRNVKLYSVTFFTFVVYSESPREVIDVLEEYISVKPIGGCGIGMCAKRMGQDSKRDAYRLWELVKLEDCDGKSLLYHASNNSRVDIFAYLLKFLRDVFERERFVKGIVQSEKFTDQMNGLLSWGQVSRICSLFRELHSVFGDEVEILFNKDSKFRMIERAFKDEELGDSFERVMSLFIECFGIEKLREFLPNRDSKAEVLIRKLIHKFSNRIFMKPSRLINKILDDKEKMKRLLNRNNGNYLCSIFRVPALERDMYIDDLLQFCNSGLDKDYVKELLFSTDECGRNVMNYLFENNSIETLMKNLKVVMEIFVGEEWLQEFLMGKRDYFRNVIHLAANWNKILDDLFNFCDTHLGKDEMKELLISTDEDGFSVIHSLVLSNSSEILMKNLEVIKEISDDEEWFKKFIKSKGLYFRNIFHFAAENQKEVNLSFLNSYLCDSEIANLLTDRDEDDQTCLHYAAYHLRNVPFFLRYAHEILKSERYRFKTFVLRIDNYGNTFLHRAGKWCENVSGLLSNIFNLLREELSDELFKRLISYRNANRLTFLQIDSEIREELIQFCKGILEKDLFEGLLQTE